MMSGFCKMSDFYKYQKYCKTLFEVTKYNRKSWEYLFALEAFSTGKRAKPGGRALGFGVGVEIVPSVLAALGVEVVATDQAESAGWELNREYLTTKADLHHSRFVSAEQFDKLVSVERVDMRAIPPHLMRGEFDYVWSLGSLEHLGSLDASNEFIFDSLKCLKPGGRAIHTTEFAIFPYAAITAGPTIFYNYESLPSIIMRLTERGYRCELDWDMGSLPMDYWVDFPPYDLKYHLKLWYNGIVCTSVALVIDKPNPTQSSESA
jgi:SAM-dependent methyltransferase